MMSPPKEPPRSTASSPPPNATVIDPQAYLTGVLARIPSMPVSQLDKLLPERWEADCAAAPKMLPDESHASSTA